MTVSWVRTVEGDMLSSKNWASPWLWRGLERVDSSVVELTRPEAWSVRVVMAVSKFIAGVGIGLVVGQSMVVVVLFCVLCGVALWVVGHLYLSALPPLQINAPKRPPYFQIFTLTNSEQRNQATEQLVQMQRAEQQQ